MKALAALMASLLTTAESLDLAGHLRALGAPRAAQRLDGGPPPVAPTSFTVDSSKVHLVADEAAAAAFSADVRVQGWMRAAAACGCYQLFAQLRTCSTQPK